MPKTAPYKTGALRMVPEVTLYYDSRNVKPEHGGLHLFTRATTDRWQKSMSGRTALRHLNRTDPCDPIVIMRVVAQMMRLDVYSEFTANDMTAVLRRHQREYTWDRPCISAVLGGIYRYQKESGAPTFGEKKALQRRSMDGIFTYCMYPDVKTYIWLGELVDRLYDVSLKELKKEKKTGRPTKRGRLFPGRFLCAPKSEPLVVELEKTEKTITNG